MVIDMLLSAVCRVGHKNAESVHAVAKIQERRETFEQQVDVRESCRRPYCIFGLPPVLLRSLVE